MSRAERHFAAGADGTGGWKSYEMVLRYSHLAPEKLSSVARRIERQLAESRRALIQPYDFPMVSMRVAGASESTVVHDGVESRTGNWPLIVTAPWQPPAASIARS